MRAVTVDLALLDVKRRRGEKDQRLRSDPASE